MKKISKEEIQEIISRYKNGETKEQISKTLHHKVDTIRKILKENGIKNIKRTFRTWSDKEVIDLYNKGISLTQIQRETGINRNSIAKVLKNHGIEVVNKQNQTKFNENIFDSIDTEEKAYWLGFIFADGNISSPNKKGKPIYTFEISLQLADTNHLYKFNKFMEHQKNNVKTDSFRCRWSVTNKHLWEILNSYGCTPRKSLTLEFPKLEIFKDKSLIRHFIRGYFDGDGCISHNDQEQEIPCINVLGTNEMLSTIQNYILMDSNPFYLNNPKNKTTLVISRSTAKAVMFMYALYYKSNIYLDRKYQKFLQYKNCRFKAKALELLEGKIGEGWDANPELIADLKDLQQCNA